MFQGLTNLQTLYLNINKLRTLPEWVFHGLTSLQELYLSHNQFTTPEGVFYQLLRFLHFTKSEQKFRATHFLPPQVRLLTL
jgi:Leucine-rich repeat (LRR) protein